MQEHESDWILVILEVWKQIRAKPSKVMDYKWKKKILCKMKLSVEYEGKIKAFLGTQSIRKFTTLASFLRKLIFQSTYN